MVTTSMGNKNVMFGAIRDYTIREVLVQLATQINSDAGVLITCVDSGRFATAGEVDMVFSKYGVPGRSFEYGFCATLSNIQQLADHDDLFTGFDEMWIWRDCKEIVRPPEYSLTSESTLDQYVGNPALLPRLTALLDWFRKSSCIIALGDGCGVNFIVDEFYWRQGACYVEGQTWSQAA